MFGMLEKLTRTRFSLPLVVRELQEQSARRRTYIIRLVYASLFFLACLLVILPTMSRVGNAPLSMLGIGKEMFVGIIGWQFAGVYLFLPAMTCGVLTVEKERNTLGLLFLTRLGPWTIIFEKLLSRLLPMFALMFCSLPLMAFCISFGGVNTIDIVIGVWFLSLTAFQICAFAVACSSFFRTTTGAILGCYALMFIVGFGMPISDWLIFDEAFSHFLRNTNVLRFFGNSGPPDEIVMFCFVGFLPFVIQIEGRMLITTSLWSVAAFNFIMSVPLFGSGMVALFVARLCLVRRAFIPSSNILLGLLKAVDRTFHALNNNRFTKGVIVLKDNLSLPDDAPIAWRETNKRSLGQTRYLIRILMALEIPVLLMIIAIIWRSAIDRVSGEATSLATILAWLVSALLVTVTSAGLISGERGRQTLDILLALPISGRQIILDKIAGVRRLAWVCAVPLVTCVVFEAWWRDIVGHQSWGQNERYNWSEYLATALSLVVTYIPLMMWLSLWISLKTKSPTRATLTALVTVVGWCIVPLILIMILWEIILVPFVGHRNIESNGFGMLLQFSPLGLLLQSEMGSLRRWSDVPYLPMLLNTIWYGSIALLIRWRVLSKADELLGRRKPRPAKTFHPPLTTMTRPIEGIDTATT